MSNLIFLPLVFPLLGFALCLLLKKNQSHQKIVSIVTSVLYICCSGWLLMMSQLLPLSIQMGGWESPFGVMLAADMLSVILLSVTGLLYLAVSVYVTPGVNAEDSPFFFPLFHTVVLGISGAFLTGDLFNLYVWFEVTLLSSFSLMGLSTFRERLTGHVKYVVLNVLSSLVFLLAAGLIYNAAHTLQFADLVGRLSLVYRDDPNYVIFLSILLFSAFAIKSALFPFFMWLPASYFRLSPAISGLFAGLLTKVGLYAIFRVNFHVFPESAYVTNTVAALACMSMLLGVFGAIFQTHIRQILSFHIISQVGYIAAAGIFMGSQEVSVKVAGVSIALFYMVHHIIVKANLFLVSGLIYERAGTEDLAGLGGLQKKYPWVALLFAVPALSLAGIPPSSGFWAKFGLIKLSVSQSHFIATSVMLIAGFFTVYSMSKIWIGAFWSSCPMKEKEHDLKSGSRLPVLACGILGGVSLFLAFQPDFLMDGAEIAAKQLVHGVQGGRN